MKIDIWSDIACPWCYVGKRRLEKALESFEHRDELEVEWRSFELDPGAPPERDGSVDEYLARKYGMSIDQARRAIEDLTNVAAAEGLEFNLLGARSGNTFDAHRLIHMAKEEGLADAMKERLLRAYFSENELVSDGETLLRLAVEVGLAEEEVRAVLEGDAYAEQVRQDEADAMEIGVRGVPFFIIDQKYGISGAQPPTSLIKVLENAWSEANPESSQTEGPGCDTTGCDVPDPAEVS